MLLETIVGSGSRRALGGPPCSRRPTTGKAVPSLFPSLVESQFKDRTEPSLGLVRDSWGSPPYLLRPAFGSTEMLADPLLPCFRPCPECLHRTRWSGGYSAGSPASPPAKGMRTRCGLALKRFPDPVCYGGDRPRNGVGPRADRMLGGHLIDVEVNRGSVRFSFECCRRSASVGPGNVP